MNRILVDSNIILNVCNRETDPKTATPLWKSSSILLEKIKTGETAGYLCITSLMEILHKVKSTATEEGLSPETYIRQAVKIINGAGLQNITPDALTLSNSLAHITDRHLDPFDAILVSAAVNEEMEAIISRDKKLKKHTSAIIPVLTPEEFLK